jgi:catechol 2,3-dioxygenase-like lactoylglutathione lyase family enzyme
MRTTFKIDHLVIMVGNLATAIKDYAALGFTVLEGGLHKASPTHNALIVFADGVYLEIIALRPGAENEPRSSRLEKWVPAGPGLVDMALLPGDIEADIAAARQRGLNIEDAVPGGRQTPDGRQIAWQTANLKDDGLPFFCADITPRSWRAPEGDIRRHANGATGVADVTLAVADLAAGARQWQALLGIEPQLSSNSPVLEGKTAVFFLDEMTTITLAQPENETGPLQAYLAVGGARPYSFTLRASASGELDLVKAHGARIKLIDT